MKIFEGIFRREEGILGKAYIWIMLFIWAVLILAIVKAALHLDWAVLFVSSLALLLTFSVRIFESRYHVKIPLEFEIFAVVLIFATLFLGEIEGYYTKIWWWDLVIHSGSALALGLLGFMILYVLNTENQISSSPGIISMFAFFFSLGIGALWEIFEFTMDMTLGLNLQKSGLLDTMGDLVVTALGALIAAICGYFYIKNSRLFFMDRLLKKFISSNPWLKK